MIRHVTVTVKRSDIVFQKVSKAKDHFIVEGFSAHRKGELHLAKIYLSAALQINLYDYDHTLVSEWNEVNRKILDQPNGNVDFPPPDVLMSKPFEEAVSKVLSVLKYDKHFQSESDFHTIQIGENIRVSIKEDRSLDGWYEVRKGGYILMPSVGRIYVAGLSEIDASKAIYRPLTGG